MPEDPDVSISKKTNGQSIAGCFLEEVKAIDGMPENFDPNYFAWARSNQIFHQKKKEAGQLKESEEDKRIEREARMRVAEETQMAQEKEEFENYLKQQRLPSWQSSFNAGQSDNLVVRNCFRSLFRSPRLRTLTSCFSCRKSLSTWVR